MHVKLAGGSCFLILTITLAAVANAANDGPTPVAAGLVAEAGTEKSDWLKELEASCLKHRGLPAELAANKITALYYSAEWCGPCKFFTPLLLEFRDRHIDQFQIVLVSRDTDEESMLRYWNAAGFKCAVIREKDLADVIKPFAPQGIPALAVFAPDGTLLTKHGRGLLQVPESDGEWLPVRAEAAQHASAKTWQSLLHDHRQLMAAHEQKEAEKNLGNYRAMLAAVEAKYRDKPLWPVVNQYLQLKKDHYVDWRDDTRAAVAALVAYGTEIGRDLEHRAGELDDLEKLLTEDLTVAGQQGYHPLFHYGKQAFFSAGRYAKDPAAARQKFLTRIETSARFKGLAVDHLIVPALTGTAVAGDDEARHWLAKQGLDAYVVSSLGLGAAEGDHFCSDLLITLGGQVTDDGQFIFGVALARGAVKGNAAMVDALILHQERWPSTERRADLAQAATLGNKAAEAYLAKAQKELGN